MNNMIQYRKSDGSLGQFDSDKLHKIEAKGNTFTVTLIYYGWDEYDYWYDTIEDIIELRIG
jgi:hypothetical protein